MRILFREKAISNIDESFEYQIQACELDPGVRNIFVHNPLNYGKSNKFISFPYVQLGFTKFQKNGQHPATMVFAGMTKTPFDETNLSHPLPLPNCYDSFYVCGIHPLTIEELCQFFWNSKFRPARYPGEKSLEKSSMKNINVWQKMTLIAPEFILSEGCNYGNVPQNLKEQMKAANGEINAKYEKF